MKQIILKLPGDHVAFSPQILQVVNMSAFNRQLFIIDTV